MPVWCCQCYDICITPVIYEVIQIFEPNRCFILIDIICATHMTTASPLVSVNIFLIHMAVAIARPDPQHHPSTILKFFPEVV
jgi:hypothetical protein